MGSYKTYNMRKNLNPGSLLKFFAHIFEYAIEDGRNDHSKNDTKQRKKARSSARKTCDPTDNNFTFALSVRLEL